MTRLSLPRRATTIVLGTLLTVLGASARARACPVCFAADERTRMSFLWTAVLLSALPLALFAGLAFWFWLELERSKPADRRDEVPALR